MTESEKTVNDFRICITERGCGKCSRWNLCNGLRDGTEISVNKALAMDVNRLIGKLMKEPDLSGVPTMKLLYELEKRNGIQTHYVEHRQEFELPIVEGPALVFVADDNIG